MSKSFSKLRGRIIEKYGTITNFADNTRKSRVAVFNKLSGATDFSKDDICEWAGLLDIQQEDFGAYFFED